MHIASFVRASALLALVAVVTPAAAQAQLGKWVKQKAAEKVAGKAVESVLGPSEGQGAAASGADPFAKGKVIPITADVLDRFVVAYQKEKGEEERRTDIEKYAECTYSEQFDEEKMSELTSQRYNATSELDSAKIRSIDAQIAKLRAGKCGQAPADWDEDNTQGPFERAGAAAGQFAHKDYLVLRERLEAYYYMQRKDRADDYRQYTFSAAEREAIKAREAELVAMIRKAVE